MEIVGLDEDTFQNKLTQMKKDCVESRFMEAHVIAGVSIESGKIAERYKLLPLIKLDLPLKDKYIYKDSMAESIWSMLSDKDTHTIVLFLDIHFQQVRSGADFKILFKYDEHGKFSASLWELMNLFGKHMYNGGKQVFENNEVTECAKNRPIINNIDDIWGKDDDTL